MNFLSQRKKYKFINALVLLMLLLRVNSIEAKIFNKSKNYLEEDLNANLSEDLSEEFKNQQKLLWKDYNKCVEIYNSANYLYTGDFSNSRILLRNENGQEVIYRITINENSLENTPSNKKFSFQEKCFKKVDFQLWKIVIGNTYTFKRDADTPGVNVGPVIPDATGAIQYKWKDNSKNELITYRKVPYEPIIKEVLVKKCPIKVKENDLYSIDTNYKYSIKNEILFKNYIDNYGYICIDKQLRDENFGYPQIINIRKNSQFNCITREIKLGKDSSISKNLIDKKYQGEWLDQKDLKNAVSEYLKEYGTGQDDTLFPKVSVNSVSDSKLRKIYSIYEPLCK